MEHLILSMVLGFTITTIAWLVIRGRKLEREWRDLKEWNETLGGKWNSTYKEDPFNPQRIWERDKKKILEALRETDNTTKQMRDEKREQLKRESRITQESDDTDHDDSPQW